MVNGMMINTISHILGGAMAGACAEIRDAMEDQIVILDADTALAAESMADDMSVEEEQHPEALDEPRADGGSAIVLVTVSAKNIGAQR
jgi:hypothetical protein